MSEKSIEILSTKLSNFILLNKLEKIIELTYSYEEYKWYYFNITLFSDFLLLNKDDFLKLDYNSLKAKLELRLSDNIIYIDNVLSESEILISSPKLIILNNTLKYIKNILKLVSLWIPFELEKAWLKHELRVEDQENIIKKIEEIDFKLFWKFIIEDNEYVRWVYIYLNHLLDINWELLTEKEKKSYLKYIELLKKKFNIDIKLTKNNNNSNFENDCLNNNISREDYVKIYNFILEEIYELPQKVVITKASSIYDWNIFLEIPDNNSHNFIKTSRFLGLISHEIESHYINLYNNELLLWWFRWAKNLEKEEWLAEFMEFILSWKNINDEYLIHDYVVKTLFAEYVKWNDFLEFMKLYSKISRAKRDYKTDFLRQKRNYSLNLKWSQHKDISYWVWKAKVIQYLKSWNDFSELFIWKVWFDEIWILSEISLWNNNLLYPLFLWEIIKFHIVNSIDSNNFNIEKVVLYIESKYNFKWIEKFQLKTRIKDKENEIKILLWMIDWLFQ